MSRVTLGINDSHDGSAAIFVGSDLVFAIAEERCQRVKAVGGFPLNAVNECLKFVGTSASEVDDVVVAGTRAVPLNMLGTLSTFRLADYLKIQERIRKPLYETGLSESYDSVFPDFQSKGDSFYDKRALPFKTFAGMSNDERAQVACYRGDFISKFFERSTDEITFVDHHDAHAYYGLYSSPFRSDTTVLTVDAGGDGNYYSLRTVGADGEWNKISTGSEVILGPIYSLTTLLLRLKPHEHEFKVMGLAPYAKAHSITEAKKFFHSIMQVSGVNVSVNEDVRDFYTYLEKGLRLERFDVIAGALQSWLEEFMQSWIGNVVESTATSNLVLSGGVALNVKANQALVESLPNINIFVPPGAGDESLSIGACHKVIESRTLGCKNGLHVSNEIDSLNSAFLGDDVKKIDIDDFENHESIVKDFEFVKGDPDKLAASALSAGELVAVCRGRMEFGPRALGHRSLFANPFAKGTKELINDSVKNRDFWMPFAPAVLEEDLHLYAKAEEGVDYSFMTFTAASKPLAADHLPSALHPADLSLRVQSVSKIHNPSTHRLISEFKKQTNVGALLNTSLNYHGKPIVRKPVDVVNEMLTHENIKLFFMIIEDRFYAHIDHSYKLGV